MFIYFYDYFLIILEIELLGQNAHTFFKSLTYIAKWPFRKFTPATFPPAMCDVAISLNPHQPSTFLL